MTSLPDKPRFHPREAAEYLGVDVKTIYGWISTGKMEAIRIGERILRIPRDEIKKMEKPAIE
ncbi:MAG: helix-turn-helix domain-containing protein [Desulfobacterales bacterium]|nr:helix-turn-helix domain-containing protein [Desulfobacterales bacterium]